MMRQLAIASLLVAGVALSGGVLAQSSTAPKTAATTSTTASKTKHHSAHHMAHHKAHKKAHSATGG